MQTHLDVQDEFADALLSVATPVPSSLKGAAIRRADRRFAVYRNNVAVSLVEALGARFPVVKRLVGEEFFRAMAHAFVSREPPLSLLRNTGAGRDLPVAPASAREAPDGVSSHSP